MSCGESAAKLKRSSEWSDTSGFKVSVSPIRDTFSDELCLIMTGFDSLLMLRDTMLFRVDFKENPPSESAG